MIEIIPAVLPKSFEGLEHGLGRLRNVSKLVQIDLVGTNVLEGQYALPFWEEFDFECDIMLPDPAKALEACIDAGASRIIVHAEAATTKEALTMLQPMRGGEIPTLVGVALRAHDTLEALVPFEGLYDFVQVMGIDNIGKQGEPPCPHGKELELIKALRAHYPTLDIQVDGAAAAHVQELVAAGANRLVVGSAIVNANDPIAAIGALKQEANT